MSYRFSLIILFPLVLFCSCEEDIQVMGDYPSKPIIYCILNPVDSIHYLRISKSFVIRGNPDDYTLDSDSLILKDEFYAYIEVDKPDRSGEIFYFDLSNTKQRDSGLFPREGLVTLSAKFIPKPGVTYNLYVNLPQLPKVLSGSTKVISPVKVLDPVPWPGRETTILPDQGYTLRWASSAKYSVYQLSMNLNFYEGDSIFKTANTIEISWPLIHFNEDSPILSQYINPASFYKKIVDVLNPPAEGSRRKIIGFDVEVYAGGEELSLNSLFNDQYYNSFFGLNDYTNIDGAIGVFSSISSSGSYNNRFSDFTIDYLASSDSTRLLGFYKSNEGF